MHGPAHRARTALFKLFLALYFLDFCFLGGLANMATFALRRALSEGAWACSASTVCCVLAVSYKKVLKLPGLLLVLGQ